MLMLLLQLLLLLFADVSPSLLLLKVHVLLLPGQGGTAADGKRRYIWIPPQTASVCVGS